MASKTLFQSLRGVFLPPANTANEAGGQAYQMTPQHALAQYAATGCLNATFYASAEDQLAKVLVLCDQVSPEFIARVALYARTRGAMKDLPALLCAILSVKSPGLLAEIFERVIDSPKMLRNFVQIMRSGVVGRKSLGTLPKRLIQQWIAGRTDEQLFVGSVGNAPSFADILKMVHPQPGSPARAALFGYLIGREHDTSVLPNLVQQYEKFKRNTNPGKVPVPDVPFQLLTSLPLTNKDWATIARNGSWQMTRMNLNTFLRHGVFEVREMIQIVANRLSNPRLIEQAKVFPYQLLIAYKNADEKIPDEIREALQEAMEISLNNVPHFGGKVYVCPDISGSMHSPLTGHRAGGTTKVRCVDIAALVAAAILRKNRTAEVIPFESDVVRCDLNPRDSVMTNATKLSSLPAGGTNCCAPLKLLNARKAQGDMVVYVSDNESWLDSPFFGRFNGASATETMQQWNLFKARNPQAKMVCIDIQPNATTQVVERSDVINVGGFSDQVFQLLADIARSRSNQDYWIRQIEEMKL